MIRDSDRTISAIEREGAIPRRRRRVNEKGSVLRSSHVEEPLSSSRTLFYSSTISPRRYISLFLFRAVVTLSEGLGSKEGEDKSYQR